MHNMASYTKAAMELAIKVQAVIVRAVAKKITWWQAAEIIGISDRHMRRWRERYEELAFAGSLTGSAARLPQATDLPIHSREKEDVTLCETNLSYVTTETR